MGYFTFKDCQDRRKSVGYDRRTYVICPDDTVIVEDSYYGYGIFGGKDIYDLVVDWNRPYLKDIMENIAKRRKEQGEDDYWGQDLYPVAIAAMESDEKAAEVVETLKDKLPPYIYCGKNEWKRSLGITIGCDDDNNEALPYPIKISSTPPKKPYAALKPSLGTQ